VEALELVAETLGAAIGRRATLEQLRETEVRYQALVEQIPAVLYIDHPGLEDRTSYISPQVTEILGLSAKAWQDDPELWFRHLHPDDQNFALLTYRRGVAARRPFSYEYRMLTPRGLVWIRDDAVVIPEDDGTVTVQGVMFDVTEQKLAEEALLASEGREREAAERLRALDQMKNTFLAAVSHELRSPLTTVLGLAVTLETMDLPERERNDLLGRLSANARKLERLLSDLLDIDRLSRGIVTAERHTVDVGELVRVTVSATAEHMGEREVEVEAGPILASVDAPKVERIVENLMVNAARHTPEGTTVWVRAVPFRDGALIVVEDDGPGIPDDLKASIFDPFRQGPTHSPHRPGTGIGLTLVRHFVELHSGSVWVEDRAGGGASFHAYLPDTDAQVPD
jgi:PAS domain S-box-containing protein